MTSSPQKYSEFLQVLISNMENYQLHHDSDITCYICNALDTVTIWSSTPYEPKHAIRLRRHIRLLLNIQNSDSSPHTPSTTLNQTLGRGTEARLNFLRKLQARAVCYEEASHD